MLDIDFDPKWKNQHYMMILYDFDFSFLLVVCPNFDSSAQLNFWLNWVNLWILGPILASYNSAQVSYLISQNS